MSLCKRIALFALAASVALSAAAAAQASNGTTAFTCQNVGSGGTFVREHCAAADVAAEGKFSHVQIPEKTGTELALSNEKTAAGTAGATAASFEMTIVGFPFEIVASGVKGSGTIVNPAIAKGAEHFAEGTLTLEYTGAVVKGEIGAGCKIKGGKIVTYKLALTTAGQGMGLKLSPLSGEEFAAVEIEGCTIIPGFNGSHPLKGTITGTPDGATTTFSRTATTGQATLKFGAATVGAEGSLTLSARATGSGSAYTPLSFTTVETP